MVYYESLGKSPIQIDCVVMKTCDATHEWIVFWLRLPLLDFLMNLDNAASLNDVFPKCVDWRDNAHMETLTRQWLHLSTAVLVSFYLLFFLCVFDNATKGHWQRTSHFITISVTSEWAAPLKGYFSLEESLLTPTLPQLLGCRPSAKTLPYLTSRCLNTS